MRTATFLLLIFSLIIILNGKESSLDSALSANKTTESTESTESEFSSLHQIVSSIIKNGSNVIFHTLLGKNSLFFSN